MLGGIRFGEISIPTYQGKYFNSPSVDKRGFYLYFNKYISDVHRRRDFTHDCVAKNRKEPWSEGEFVQVGGQAMYFIFTGEELATLRRFDRNLSERWRKLNLRANLEKRRTGTRPPVTFSPKVALTPLQTRLTALREKGVIPPNAYPTQRLVIDDLQDQPPSEVEAEIQRIVSFFDVSDAAKEAVKTAIIARKLEKEGAQGLVPLPLDDALIANIAENNTSWQDRFSRMCETGRPDPTLCEDHHDPRKALTPENYTKIRDFRRLLGIEFPETSDS